ncbi:expressed unknown protein [Seminavis robusta]|uniref:Transmembrane protein n=1 Tax=Seminavis robusta TaxID=568900 RepID=A0A9N8D8S3_9STRA|nr:expressed unknown protein [Seminavis robusta]|eukprot:Sro43_g026040.1 n/a (263) ;mRNA; r:37571-38359
MASYTLASPTNNDHFDSSTMKPTVLLLRGWTPGPVYALRNRLQTEFDCDVIEPNLLMPPFYGIWCLDTNFLLMLLVCGGLLWSLVKVWVQFESLERFTFLAILVAFGIFWIRLMVAVVARSAIADGVEKCLKEMRRRNVVLCVGFSWGAGVLTELLTKDIGLDTRPAFVLMAPVSSATAMAAMRDDAAFRLRPLDNNDLVHVVHASHDPVFCPHPERWNNIPGIKAYTLSDVHIFKNASSRRALEETVTGLYRLKTEGHQEP